MFCAIEPLIGDAQDSVNRVSIAPELRHSNTDGDADRRLGADVECSAFNGRSKALRDSASRVEGRPRQQHHELFTADARDGVVGADRLQTLAHEYAEDLIADAVTTRVIDILEMVEVERQQG
ncbi:hypothetical protein ACVWZ4_000210 [Bradyrhizobium sp. USDA 4472]